MPLITGDGAPPPLLTVVEYLESPMSSDLLCKFPDNSAFDFNYAQSSIWSPLLPRPPPMDPSGGHRREISRKLSYGGNGEAGLLENTKKIAARIKKKFTDTVIDNVAGCSRMKRRRRRKSFGFSQVSPAVRSSSSLRSPKVWDKVMKAAAKHFKKRKNKKKDLNLQFDLSDYLTKP